MEPPRRFHRTERLSRWPLGHNRLGPSPPLATHGHRSRALPVVAPPSLRVAQHAIGLLDRLKRTTLHARPVGMQLQSPATKSRPDVFPACVLGDAQNQVIVLSHNHLISKQPCQPRDAPPSPLGKRAQAPPPGPCTRLALSPQNHPPPLPSPPSGRPGCSRA